MKREPIFIILNPTAKSERAKALEQEIRQLCAEDTIKVTQIQGDACTMAKEAVSQGFKTVVAAGGDGTVKEVVNGLENSDSVLGILPVGTMNVFASELGLPQNNLAAAIKVIREGAVREIDLPQGNGECFVQLGGVGLDAEVVGRTTLESKKTLGPLSYLLTLAQVAAQPAPTLQIEPIDGPRREGRFVLVGNGKLYGGPFVLFKNARLNDGLLDILVFKNQSHWDIIRYLQAIAFGNHPELSDVEYFQTRRLRVSSSGPVPVELDGDIAGSLPCEFGFSERRLRVHVPIDKGGSSLS